jgi:hypothetical protein
MTTVASEDNSRVIRSSSPFGLYSSGVNTITGLPNGQKLVDIPLSAEKPKDGSPWPAGAEQVRSANTTPRPFAIYHIMMEMDLRNFSLHIDFF